MRLLANLVHRRFQGIGGEETASVEGRERRGSGEVGRGSRTGWKAALFEECGGLPTAATHAQHEAGGKFLSPELSSNIGAQRRRYIGWEPPFPGPVLNKGVEGRHLN